MKFVAALLLALFAVEVVSAVELERRRPRPVVTVVIRGR